MSQTYFGATQGHLFLQQDVFSVPISRIRCNKCMGVSAGQYFAWSNMSVEERDRREASALLTELVERDHPQHKHAVYGGLTLEELRQQVGQKARVTAI